MAASSDPLILPLAEPLVALVVVAFMEATL